MTMLSDKTWDLFTDAALSDDGRGYADDVQFIPADAEWGDSAALEALGSGRAVVLVDHDLEFLITPSSQSLVGRLARRLDVRIAVRSHGRQSSYVMPVRLGRHPLREMRELAHA